MNSFFLLLDLHVWGDAELHHLLSTIALDMLSRTLVLFMLVTHQTSLCRFFACV